MHRRRLARAGVLLAVAAALPGCSDSGEAERTPELVDRGTVLTTVKPVRQDLANRISLSGKVAINPVFGIATPADGELRWVDRQPPSVPAARPLWVASVWDDNGDPQRIEVPKDSMMAGRLMADRSDVTAGMPVVSARHAGYGVVAEIDSAQAYRIQGALKTVQAQIKNGPGPFSCTALGTIAALPAGSFPPPPPPPTPSPGAEPETPPEGESTPEGSEATGMRLVCAAPESVKLINGADVTLSVVTAKAAKALVLPVEAVAGVQGRGKVDIVVKDQTRKTVDVVLGLTDGKVVQIKSGLRGDETIAVPGPDLPPAAPNPGDNPSGGPG